MVISHSILWSDIIHPWPWYLILVCTSTNINNILCLVSVWLLSIAKENIYQQDNKHNCNQLGQQCWFRIWMQRSVRVMSEPGSTSKMLPHVCELYWNCIFQCMGNIFVCNFKGTLWNYTQNILPIHWKMCILFIGENITAYNVDTRVHRCFERSREFKNSFQCVEVWTKRPTFCKQHFSNIAWFLANCIDIKV